MNIDWDKMEDEYNKSFSHDPRSPFYDDGGKDSAIEEMINNWHIELDDMHSVSFKEVKEFHYDLLFEIVDFMRSNNELTFDQAMEAMANHEWENQ